MTWFKVDDKLHSHRKTMRATVNGMAAMGLWVLAGSWCGDHNSDGFIPQYAAARLDPHGWEEDARVLVTAGFWEPAERDGEQGWMFHDWLDVQPSREQVVDKRVKNARRQALFRDPALRNAVRTRDCDLCRYCGTRVKWNDRRSPSGGTYDYVDPNGGNTLANLVVACRACNSAKGSHLPHVVGMTLLPPAVTSYVSGTKLGSASPPTRPDPTPPLKGGREEVVPLELQAAKALAHQVAARPSRLPPRT